MAMVAAALGNAKVLDQHGCECRLGDVWREKPTVLVFVRHFGCLFCRDQIVELQKSREQIERAGGQLCVVGCGAPHFVRGFREETGFGGIILTDPTLASFRAAGFWREPWRLLEPRGWLKLWSTLWRGIALVRPIQGDLWQLGGVMVVGPLDQLHYRYVSEYGGDHPQPEQVIDALGSRSSAVTELRAVAHAANS